MTQRSFWARSSAELNPGDPDFSVRILQSSRGSTNSPTFYLPPSIGLLKFNFRNAITRGLHERACWPDFTWTTDELISWSCTCETCFFCVFFFFSFFFVFLSSLRTKYHTPHDETIHTSKDSSFKKYRTAFT